MNINFILLIIFVNLFEFHSLLAFQQKLYPSEYNYSGNAKVHTEKLNSKTSKPALNYPGLKVLKKEFILNSGCGEYGADQTNVTVASSYDGNFLCAWNDRRAGDEQVMALLFDKNGNKVGDEFQVSNGNANWNSEPHITFNSFSNEFIVLWAGNGYNVFFQRIDSEGNKIGNNIWATDQAKSNTNNPSAAIVNDGQIIITWTSDITCCSSTDPFARIFSADGIPLTDTWSLSGSNKGRVNSSGYNDRIASDSSGSSVVVWSEHFNGQSRIALQQIKDASNYYDEPLIVSEIADERRHAFPAVTSMHNGKYLIYWESDGYLLGKVYSSETGWMSEQFSALDTSYGWITYHATNNDSDKFYVICTGDKPYARTISANGKIISDTKTVDVLSDIKLWSYPKLSNDYNSGLNLVYAAYNRSQQDIVLQRMDTLFNPISPATKIVDDKCSAAQKSPMVLFNNSGTSIVVWIDERNGYRQLYGQLFNSFGNKISEDFLISRQDTMKHVTNPYITFDKLGDFYVTFASGRSSLKNIAIQKISRSGDLIGNNTWLTTGYKYGSRKVKTKMVFDSTGNLQVTWLNERYRILSQTFDPSFKKKNNPKNLLQSTLESRKYILDFCVNKELSSLLVWSDYKYDTNETGNTIKSILITDQEKDAQDTLIISKMDEETKLSSIECKVDRENNLLFAWAEYDKNRNRRLIVKRYYDNYYSKSDTIKIYSYHPKIQIVKFSNKFILINWSDNLQINSIFIDDSRFEKKINNLHSIQYLPRRFLYDGHYFSSAIFEDKLKVIYTSAHNWETGLDIYGKIFELDNFSFSEREDKINTISSLYPNPCNSIINFEYIAHEPIDINISLYDILGQMIKSTSKTISTPGKYELSIELYNVSSGIYFLKIDATEQIVQKFIVLK